MHRNVTVRMHTRAAIERLRKENEQLKEEIAITSRGAGKSSTQSISAQVSPAHAVRGSIRANSSHLRRLRGQIARLQDQADVYIRKIELEKRALEESDKQVHSRASCWLPCVG